MGLTHCQNRCGRDPGAVFVGFVGAARHNPSSAIPRLRGPVPRHEVSGVPDFWARSKLWNRRPTLAVCPGCVRAPPTRTATVRLAAAPGTPRTSRTPDSYNKGRGGGPGHSRRTHNAIGPRGPWEGPPLPPPAGRARRRRRRVHQAAASRRSLPSAPLRVTAWGGGAVPRLEKGKQTLPGGKKLKSQQKNRKCLLDADNKMAWHIMGFRGQTGTKPQSQKNHHRQNKKSGGFSGKEDAWWSGSTPR